jgi:hypothetical protein
MSRRSNDLGPLPEVDPRDEAIKAAGIRLATLVEDLRANHELTLSELFFVLGSEVIRWTGLAIQGERRRGREDEDDDDGEKPRKPRPL